MSENFIPTNLGSKRKMYFCMTAGERTKHGEKPLGVFESREN